MHCKKIRRQCPKNGINVSLQTKLQIQYVSYITLHVYFAIIYLKSIAYNNRKYIKQTF